MREDDFGAREHICTGDAYVHHTGHQLTVHAVYPYVFLQRTRQLKIVGLQDRFPAFLVNESLASTRL